jgi:TetR/AcrR family transcriptional regulator
MDTMNMLTHQYLAEVAALLQTEKLRDGVRWEHVFFVIECIAQGFRERYISQVPDVIDDNFERSFQKHYEELDLYFDIIKRGVYREVDDR